MFFYKAFHFKRLGYFVTNRKIKEKGAAHEHLGIWTQWKRQGHPGSHCPEEI
jgi:hypothetical protein